MNAGKRESVFAVYKYGVIRIGLDGMRFFRVSSGMIGRHSGIVGDSVLPTFS